MVKRSWLLLSCLVWGVAFAQFSVQTNVPEGSTLRIGQQEISLDLGQVAFPPLAFPAYFDLTRPGSPITINLFSNIAGGWALRVNFTGLESREDLLLPSQIEYRLNGVGDWLPLGPSINLLNSYGASTDFENHRLELRLRLLGNERPGSYEGRLVFSLAPL